MAAFDSPGLAIGIVAGDKLVYGKGFGVRKKGGEPVDTRTVFQTDCSAIPRSIMPASVSSWPKPRPRRTPSSG
jgi:hypothetical protein